MSLTGEGSGEDGQVTLLCNTLYPDGHGEEGMRPGRTWRKPKDRSPCQSEVRGV